ncbi:MAG: hypothetical protein JNK05_29345 [Myxococcales bacterium]|nr:hypothetical protein [Myxococcales bacterium]
MPSLPPLSRWTFYAATAGAALVSVALAMGRVPSRVWPAAAIVAYVALVALGLKKPSLRMFTDAIARAPDGAAMIVEVPADARAIESLCALFEAHDGRATLALSAEDAAASRDALVAAIERGHALAITDREAREHARTRGAAVDARIDRLEREHALLHAQFSQDFYPDLWLPSGLYTPALQRLADAFDRTLVAPSHDLRGKSRFPLAERIEHDLEHGAILRVEDSPSLRAALPAVLAAAARLGVPVRALVSRDAAQEA